MSLVLAGALSGLGEGLQTVGKQRREDWLREQKRREKIAEEERQAALRESGRGGSGGGSGGRSGGRRSSGRSRGLGGASGGEDGIAELPGWAATDIERGASEMELPFAVENQIKTEVGRLIASGVAPGQAIPQAFEALTAVTEDYQLRDDRGFIERTIDGVQERWFGAEPYEPETRQRETGEYRFDYSGQETTPSAAPGATPTPRGLGPAPDVMAQAPGLGAMPTPQGPGVSVSGAPQVGEVIDGYRFLGGNPADQSNWEPV